MIVITLFNHLECKCEVIILFDSTLLFSHNRPMCSRKSGDCTQNLPGLLRHAMREPFLVYEHKVRLAAPNFEKWFALLHHRFPFPNFTHSKDNLGAVSGLSPKQFSESKKAKIKIGYKTSSMYFVFENDVLSFVISTEESEFEDEGYYATD